MATGCIWFGSCRRFEKTRQNDVAGFLQNRNGFWRKKALKTKKRKESLPRRPFRLAKPMLLPFKNIGFTSQKLWFCTSKPMLLQPKSIGISIKYLISSLEKNFLSLYLMVNQ